VKISSNIQELFHCKSKRHETKLMHPSSLRALQRDQEHDMKHLSSMDLISTKQNKQTTSLLRQISTEISFFWAKTYFFASQNWGKRNLQSN
jgi:hypothetical protein